MRLVIRLLLFFCLSGKVLAAGQVDSTRNSKLAILAKKMHLKETELEEGDYEVRIWNKCGLCFGDAQMLYRLIKKQKSFTVFKYIILSDQRGFRHATSFKPTVPVTDNLWSRLVEQGILTLPDQAAIHDQLFPKPQKDSTWTVIEADGSVSVKAKIRQNRSVLISDGESYYFDVFSATGYHNYGYSNPREYLKAMPTIAELQKVVGILDELAPAFNSTN
ncbi:hypothetical protein [Spirosoma endbachense]|uniref:Uncharacterized protein n=1 Tax=Spirosoma endbachense TaxID=2666025 RepID=A0A6P1W5J0_9BACT|nr:hypothetical protein [Spirosoma endbachense]QHV98986.1 hypothetical protein GJR95_30040 [Spirosoma endbachense]